MRRLSRRPGVPRTRFGRTLAAWLSSLAIAAAAVAPTGALAATAPSPRLTGPVAPAAAVDVSAKLRGGLTALVAGTLLPDPRIAGLVPGYQPGELAAFAVLTEPCD